MPADTTFCPECSAYVAWDEEREEEAAAESPRLPGEQAPPPPPPQDATTPMQPVESDVVDCPSCGEGNPASRSLCQRCGASLHSTPAPAPPEPQPSRSPRGLWIGLGLLALLGVVALGLVLLGGDDDPGSDLASPASSPDPSPERSPEPTAEPTPEPSPDPSPEPSPDPSPEPSPTVDEPTEPPFFANTEPDTEEPVGAGVVEQVTVSGQPEYDQISFAVDGPGVGWLVEYVEDPRLQGSGRAVDVEGDTVLRVLLRQVGPLEEDLGEVRPTGTSAIVELVEGTWFEGQLGFFVGLDGPRRPFRMIPDDDGGALLQVDTTGTG